MDKDNSMNDELINIRFKDTETPFDVRRDFIRFDVEFLKITVVRYGG